ncbi:hypothetical protein, partial [Escherichia coli]
KTSIFSHPVYLFLRKFSLQDSRGGSTSKKLLVLMDRLVFFEGIENPRVLGSIPSPGTTNS